MQRGSAHIQTAVLSAESKADVKVKRDANTGRYKHHERLNRLRMLEALHSFPENHNGDKYQCDSVSQGRQDTHAVIPERFASISRPFRLRNGKPGKAERKDIGDDMPGIGEQRKGICNKTASEFCYKDQHG